MIDDDNKLVVLSQELWADIRTTLVAFMSRLTKEGAVEEVNFVEELIDEADAMQGGVIEFELDEGSGGPDGQLN